MLPADSIRDKHHCSSLGITNSRHGNYRTWASSSLPPVRQSFSVVPCARTYPPPHPLGSGLSSTYNAKRQSPVKEAASEYKWVVHEETDETLRSASSSSFPGRASQCQMFVKLLTSDTELCPERMSVHPGIASSRRRRGARLEERGG